MQIMKCFIRLTAFLCPIFSFAQSTYIPLGSKDYDFINRMEIKLKQNKHLNFSTVKPYNRKTIISQLEYLDYPEMMTPDPETELDAYSEYADLTPVDEYNLPSLLMNNSEWVITPRDEFESVAPIFNKLYDSKANLLEINNEDFFLAINPILNLQFGTASGNNKIYLNTRGISARGMIANEIGFSASITENQERGPDFFNPEPINFVLCQGWVFTNRSKKMVMTILMQGVI